MINATDTVTLCIGGRIFVTRRSTLYRVPDSRLYMIAIKHEKQFSQSSKICSSSHDHGGVVCSSSSMPSDAPIYYFDRDPEIFRFVLDFYRTGELHLPNSICGPFVRKELIFWGIDESFIGPCCMSAYMRYDEEKRTKKTLFKDCFEDIDSMKNLVKYCRGLKRLRYRLWLFFDHPSSSLLAKLWAMLLLLLMILSVTCHCLSTHEAFRMPLKNLTFYTNSAICTFEKINSNPKFHKDCTSEPRYDLAFLDVALNVLFTLEFLFKLMLAPDKIKFISSFVSMLDICILFSYWVYAIIFYKLYYYPKNHTSEPINRNILWFLNTMSMTQALRILRIFKVSKISRGLRVLILTIKKSIPELVLLAFLLMNGMFFFSCCIYVAEYWVDDTFNSIPQAFWWTIVTLTTVGYGDSYPKQGPGYFVGSITAICGCILTGLAIPIIGNNFNTYYMYMKNQIKEDKYIKELQKDLTSLTSTLRTSNIKKLAALRDGKSHQCNIVMKRKLTRANCPLTTPVLSLEIANASLKMIAKGAKTKKKKNIGKFLKIKTYDSLYKRNFPNNKIPEPEKSNFNDLTEFDPSLPIRRIHPRENYV